MNERDRGGRRRRRGGRGTAELQDLAGRALEFWGEIGRLWLSAATRLAPEGNRDRRRTTRARHRDDDPPREEQGAPDDEDRDDDHEGRDDDREERDDDHEDRHSDHGERDDDHEQRHARDDRAGGDEDDEGDERDERGHGHHAHHDRDRDEERAPKEHRAPRPGQLSVTLEISAPEQVEVTLDLRPGTSLDGLTVQSLHAIDDDRKPAIRGVVLDRVHGRPRLQIAILKDQPKGIYVGAILDQERGEARGTLRVKVPHEPTEDGGHPHRKEGSAS